MFGAAHVIDVLLGGDTERVRKFRHDELSTYGIGKEFSRNQWRSVFRQLVAHGLLDVDLDGHGGLRLSEKSRPLLRGETNIELRVDPLQKDKLRSRAKSEISLDDPADEALFQALRTRRMELARAQGVPPYVIFHDSALLEMAVKRPCDLLAFSLISGVGSAKLNRYGEDFLAVIADEGPALEAKID